MGVFKKLKDVLFDVEEDDDDFPMITKTDKKEEPKKEINKKLEKTGKIEKLEKTGKLDKTDRIETRKPKPEKPEENTIKEIKIPKDELPERELLKSESTFNFPVDVDDSPRSRSRSFEYEPPPKRKFDDVSKSIALEPRNTGEKPFKPTPIISPVYGVLDQNYSKDDIIVKTDIGVKGPDLDSVRKKAYGLENKEEKKAKEVLVEEEPEPEVEIKAEPTQELSEIVDLIKKEPEIEI